MDKCKHSILLVLISCFACWRALLFAAPSAPPPAELLGEVESLRSQVAGKNEQLKAVIDELRQMLGSLSLWDAYRRQLDLQKQSSERP